MRALEFHSSIENNQILIPKKFISEFIPNRDKKIRVIVFIEDEDVSEETNFKQATKKSFLKGYSESDSIYDAI